MVCRYPSPASSRTGEYREWAHSTGLALYLTTETARIKRDESVKSVSYISFAMALEVPAILEFKRIEVKRDKLERRALMKDEKQNYRRPRRFDS